VWGAVLDSFYIHIRSRDRLDERVWPILVHQVECALEHWRKPDRGIWEVRGEPQHFTSSKLMCWVAADRGARLARLREEPELAEQWQAAADEIREDICTHGLDQRGVFTQHYDIADELTEDGLVLRYRTDQTDDGLRGEEGAFLICSFWLVSAMAEIGEYLKARQLCEKLLSFASPLDLYAEEIDPRTGRHLGNFPQAFTHLALINAVMHIICGEADMSPGLFNRGSTAIDPIVETIVPDASQAGGASGA